MTSPTPAEQLQSDLSSIQSSVNSLQGKVRLSTLHDRLEDLDTTLKGLQPRLQVLRTRGYAFEKDLEKQLLDLQRRWINIRPNVNARLNQSCAQLEADIRPIEAQLTKLTTLSRNPVVARQLVQPLKTSISTLEGKVSSVEASITGMFDTLENEYKQMKTRFEQIEWSISKLEAACFTLLPTEACVMAVKAVWYRDEKEDKEDPDGILFLTDQRMIFEQNEEIATKKVLFIATEKKRVQQLQFEVPVSLVEEIKAYKKGFFKNEDTLEMRFRHGAPFIKAYLHISGQDCTAWMALINAVRSGDVQKSRLIQVEQAVIDKVKSAPTQCATCGGNINQPVLRGQDSINCPYCGTVIRI